MSKHLKENMTVFASSPITEETLQSDDNYVMTLTLTCKCGKEHKVSHDAGGPLRLLGFPYTASFSAKCPKCGLVDSGSLTMGQATQK
jgi:hypothetical protein